MSEAEPKIYSMEEVDINSLKFDSTNPNHMTGEQDAALERSMRRYGVLKPAVTNKEGLIADGAHGVKIGKRIGMKTYPIIRLNIDEVDRRILRQVLNKLHGEHDPELDLVEFKFLEDNDSLEELGRLLAKDEQELRKSLEDVETPSITPGAIKDVSFTAKEKVCPKCGFKS